ncbi:hypothetical protein EVAR_35748_1 [Eumeta japonica]|uniref:Uncharacterized protein n=1 Tax=Eumeta variegata TaxID=151549 RepID=A0A4C1VH84_EUMVA|nr:hypothetical protein EVAR_35748_1 [Eumeta japonica]
MQRNECNENVAPCAFAPVTGGPPRSAPLVTGRPLRAPPSFCGSHGARRVLQTGFPPEDSASLNKNNPHPKAAASRDASAAGGRNVNGSIKELYADYGNIRSCALKYVKNL